MQVQYMHNTALLYYSGKIHKLVFLATQVTCQCLFAALYSHFLLIDMIMRLDCIIFVYILYNLNELFTFLHFKFYHHLIFQTAIVRK